MRLMFGLLVGLLVGILADRLILLAMGSTAQAIVVPLALLGTVVALFPPGRP